MIRIKLADLHPHPGNPRLAPREDVIEQIAAQLTGALDDAHALIVRPNAAGYEIISGHHRALAAERAGLAEVPCWVREMSDDDAYMALALNNAQGELHPLEVGLHALRSGWNRKHYADMADSPQYQRSNAIQCRTGRRVRTDIGLADLRERWSQLAEIHAAPRWLWGALVAAMLDKGWSVDATRAAVKRVKDAATPPKWADAETIADALVTGAAKPTIGAQLTADATEAYKRIEDNEVDAKRFITALDKALAKGNPARRSEVAEIVNGIIAEQEDILRERREEARQAQREQEARAARVARLREYVSLDEWKQLSPDEQNDLLAFTAPSGPSFNKQESADIEWAQWSWNPITGCLHDCPYCYARDIAHQKRMERSIPTGLSRPCGPCTCWRRDRQNLRRRPQPIPATVMCSPAPWLTSSGDGCQRSGSQPFLPRCAQRRSGISCF